MEVEVRRVTDDILYILIGGLVSFYLDTSVPYEREVEQWVNYYKRIYSE